MTDSEVLAEMRRKELREAAARKLCAEAAKLTAEHGPELLVVLARMLLVAAR